MVVCFVPRMPAESAASSAFVETVAPSSPGTWQDFSDADLRAFINEIFLTTEQVRPELRAEGLRQLATFILPMDSPRALWVYDQAFNAAETIPITNQLGMRDVLERGIILDEAKIDLSRAVDHALALPERSLPDNSNPATPTGRMVLLVNLIRRVPAEDVEGLFQKIAPALVREDTHLAQTLDTVQFYLKDSPERAQQLFSGALMQFQSRPADELSLRSISMMTIAVSSGSPGLVEGAVEVLLKKADELDSKTDSERNQTTGLPSSSNAAYGRLHMLVLSQLLPVMQKINPARANEWTASLQDKRNLQSLSRASSPLTLRPDVNMDTPSQASTRGSAITPGSGRGPGASISRAPGGAPQFVGGRPSTEDPFQSPDQTNFQQMIAAGKQPASAFSPSLTSDLVKAQALSKNDPEDFSRRMQEILPRLQAEGDPRARAAALAQISLSYFQLRDPVRAREYLRQSLEQGQQGDSPLLGNSSSTALFFSMYSATSNAVGKLAPLFPQEAIKAIRTISDPQLRLRVMIDNIRSLNALYSAYLRPTQNK